MDTVDSLVWTQAKAAPCAKGSSTGNQINKPWLCQFVENSGTLSMFDHFVTFDSNMICVRRWLAPFREATIVYNPVTSEGICGTHSKQAKANINSLYNEQGLSVIKPKEN